MYLLVRMFFVKGVCERGYYEKRAKHALFVGRSSIFHLAMDLPHSVFVIISVAINPDSVQRFTVNAAQIEAPPQPVLGEPAPQSHRQIDYNRIGMPIQL